MDRGLAPLEGRGGRIVGLDKGVDGLAQLPDRGEAGAFERAPGENREPDLDLVEPGRMGRRVVQEDPGASVEELLDFGCEVGREVVDDAVQFQTGRRLRVEVGEELDEVVGPGVVGDPRVASWGGGSVTVLTNNNASSWS